LIETAVVITIKPHATTAKAIIGRMRASAWLPT
jgi:hypothetical protein